jgi:hypothetical protein
LFCPCCYGTPVILGASAILQTHPPNLGWCQQHGEKAGVLLFFCVCCYVDCGLLLLLCSLIKVHRLSDLTRKTAMKTAALVCFVFMLLVLRLTCFDTTIFRRYKTYTINHETTQAWTVGLSISWTVNHGTSKFLDY